ncbi:MAG TPA: thiol reductant ABC exporter subunit CydD [Vicinamibacteria bacterium]|nr:thiol reductant ABC exporter subunit CydD [Vicinamibacteria bacterium]
MRTLTRIIPPRARPLRGLALTVSLGTLAGLLVVAQAWFLSSAIDAAFLGEADLAAVGPLLLGIAVAAALRAAAAWGQEVLAQRFSGSVRRGVRDRLLRRLLALGPRFASGERAGELANTLVGGVDALDPYLAQYLPQAALSGLVPFLVWAAVLRADPLSALVLLLTFPLIPLFMWLVGGAAEERTRRQWVTLSRLAARFLDAVQGLPTLRVLGRAGDEADRIARASEDHREVTMGVLRLAFVSALALEALATLGTAIVAVEVGLRLLYARVAFREALFVLVLAPEFYRPLRALGAAFHAGMAGREVAARIAHVLEAGGPLAAPAIQSGARPAAPLVAGPGPPAIALEDVRFAYEGSRAPALDGLSLALPPGATVALVGPSGAGKTTVAYLLLRFLEPAGGAITVDGVPLAAIAPEAWRRRVAWVPQRPRLFHGTVRDNVALARPGASDAALAEAAARSRLDAVLRGLPRGWETPVGEGGERLSGGEAQRVALARAFLKDACVLVLDEPTSHLDLDGESAVVEAIEELRKGRTVLLIGHRLTTVARADHIALVARGRVAEEGTHRQLAAAGRGYASLLAAGRGAP